MGSPWGFGIINSEGLRCELSAMSYLKFSNCTLTELSVNILHNDKTNNDMPTLCIQY